MRTIFKVLSCAIMYMALGQAHAVANSKRPLKVVSYNIRHAVGMDNRLDVERVGRVLESMTPDVVAVQEVDSATHRVGGRSILAELAALTGCYATFGPAIDFDGGKYGVGILSKEKPLKVSSARLCDNSEPRTVLVAEFENYVFACTHLSLHEDNRLHAIDVIDSIAATCDKPFVIAGDWNDTPQSGTLQRMKRHFQICSPAKPTFPSDNPAECIDYIAVYKSGHEPSRAVSPGGKMDAYSPYCNEPVVVLSSSVGSSAVASDHRPVFAQLVLPTPSRRLMTTQPYLQVPTPHSMDVMFQTNSVCHCWVEYGTDSLHTRRARSLLDGQEVCYDIENRIHLDSLAPGTRYYYRVCAVELLYKHGYANHFGDTIRTPFYSFRTRAEQPEDFTYIIFNDLHANVATFDSLLNIIGGIDCDMVIFNGDCIPEPGNRKHALQLIHQLADRIGGASIPLLFVRGNHEIRNYYSAGMHSLLGYYDDRTYCAFTAGDTRFVILDLGEDKPDDTPVYGGLNDFTRLRTEQLEFLQTELNGRDFKRARHRVLISHIPVFGNVDDYRPCTEMWGPLLRCAPFSLAVAGHNHEPKLYPDGTDGAPYPVIIGGGPELASATAIVLRRKGKNIHVEVVSPNPNNCRQL